MAEQEVPGSYRWVFQGGPKGGQASYNETGAPSSIDGDERHAYQLQTGMDYPVDGDETATDVVVSVYKWIELDTTADEAGGGSWN